VGWSADFVAGLGSGSIVPEFELRFINVNGSVGGQITIGSSGFSKGVLKESLKIDDGSVQVQGTAVIPQRWAVSFGAWSVGLVGDIRRITPYIRRGQFTELWCRLNGFSGFERIAMGSLDSLSGSRGVWRLRFRDLISAFQNSLDTSIAGTYDDFQIFNRAGILTTTTDAIWNLVDTTMSVVTALDWDLPTGGPALIKCYTNHPTNTEYFFAKYTGKTSVSFTGVLGLDYPIGNVAKTALPSGSTIEYCPWILGRPWEILGKILTSTGTGSNGAFDKYPKHWGIGGQVDSSIFDNNDAFQNRGLIKRSDGSTHYYWNDAIEAPWANGLRDFVTYASKAGQWPVQRQGYISWRGCSDPTGETMGYEPLVKSRINTSDIHEILSHEFYNSSLGHHYTSTASLIKPTFLSLPYTKVSSTANFSANRVPTLPYLKEIERDLRRHYDDGEEYVGADERVSMTMGDINRMKGWDQFASEKLVLRVSLKFAVLCAGDVVEITSGFLSGLFMGPGKSYNAQRAMVLNCSYVIGSASCVLQLGILSGREKR